LRKNDKKINKKEMEKMKTLQKKEQKFIETKKTLYRIFGRAAPPNLPVFYRCY